MKKEVKIVTARQNCYIVAGAVEHKLTDINKHETQKHYFSMERVSKDRGFSDEIIKKDYPITSESVSSYAESADYKRDPIGAIANAPKRQNLGDVTQVQEFLAGDPMQALRVFESVLKTINGKTKEGKISSPIEGDNPTPSTEGNA